MLDALRRFDRWLGITEFFLNDRNQRGEKIDPTWQRFLLLLFGVAVFYACMWYACGPNTCGAPSIDSYGNPY